MTVVAIVIVGVIVGAAALLPAVLFRRCRQVDAMRSQKLRESYEDAKTDIDSGQSWEWRFDAYQNGPTFTEMVWKLWRPLSSFYKEQRSGAQQQG